ncbi:MAG: hypothetical protein QXI60_00895 [Thermofilaceae archaeon]
MKWRCRFCYEETKDYDDEEILRHVFHHHADTLVEFARMFFLPEDVEDDEDAK